MYNIINKGPNIALNCKMQRCNNATIRALLRRAGHCPLPSIAALALLGGILEGHFFLRAPLVSCFKDSKKTTFPTFSAQRLSPRGTNAFSPPRPDDAACLRKKRLPLQQAWAPATASRGSCNSKHGPLLAQGLPSCPPVLLCICAFVQFAFCAPWRSAGGALAQRTNAAPQMLSKASTLSSSSLMGLLLLMALEKGT